MDFDPLVITRSRFLSVTASVGTNRPVLVSKRRWLTENPVTRPTLIDQHLPGAFEVHHVEVRRITIAPCSPAGAHVHSGPVFRSIESGSDEFQVEGQPLVVLVAGDIFSEPAGVLISNFDALEDGVTFLGFLLRRGQHADTEFR